MTHNALFIAWVEKQVGKQYLMGAEVVLTPIAFANPNAYAGQRTWDCSEMVQGGLWAAGLRKVGPTPIAAFDGAGNQYLRSPHHLPVDEARHIPGCLLFVQAPGIYADKPAGIGHVAVVVADGIIVEARGRRYGVVRGPIRSAFNRAAKIDELFAPV